MMHTIGIGDIPTVLDGLMIEAQENRFGDVAMTPGFLGQFGAGKTKVIEQWVRDRKYYLVKVLLGQYDTVDMKGFPYLKDYAWSEDRMEGGKIQTVTGVFQSQSWAPARTLPFEGNPLFPDDIPIILFLDEITSASVAVMAVCYQLINEHCVGEHKLKRNVFIVVAGNRDVDKGVVTRMPKPLENRIIWFEVKETLKDWSNWASAKYGMDAAMHIAFLNWKKDQLCTYDPSNPKQGRVVATPRTHEFALRVSINKKIPEHVQEAAVAGAIGTGVAADLWAFKKVFYDIMRLMPEIAKNPKGAKIPDAQDQQYAICVACSGNMDPMAKRELNAYHTYLMRMSPEFTVLAWQLAINRDRRLYDTPEFEQFGAKYSALFSE